MLERRVSTESWLHHLIGPSSIYHKLNGRRGFILTVGVKTIVYNRSEQIRIRGEHAEETDGDE